MNHPTVLVILDGFGLSSQKRHNAIAHAHMPYMHYLLATYPHTELTASGYAVGLAQGFQGNSEVGHLTIGAGRVIPQIMTIWKNAIQDNSFFHNKTLTSCLSILRASNRTLHIIGLLSDAGIHSHEEQLYACIKAAALSGTAKIVIHAFLDGRDTPPQSTCTYLKQLNAHIILYPNVKLGSIHGRFYAMDRDNNWERTEKSYRVLTEHSITTAQPWAKVLERNYAHSITDEFIPPTQLEPDSIIKNGDGIIFCNIRPDRARQLTASFVQTHFTNFTIKPLILTFFITPVEYAKTLPTNHLFKRPIIANTLKDIFEEYNTTIFSIAETEKYAHVTYFFRGENEKAVHGESRVMIPSIPTQTYKNYPEMSAQLITNTVIKSLKTDPKNFYLINYANADMVGHSGDFDATVLAIECLDKQLKTLYDMIVIQMNGTLYITADHGKAEDMFDDTTNQPRTSHTCNSVPFIMINKQCERSAIKLPLTQLSDIAPFILKNMGLPIPH